MLLKLHQHNTMAFSKTFPKTIDGSNYPKWIEVAIDVDEEAECEELARKDNISLMKECIEDAKRILAEKELKDYQTDLVHIAVALFRKRAAYTVHYKENKAKEKFDQLFNS